MNVLGNIKKLSLGGLVVGGWIIAGSFSVTGCLTSDDDTDTTEDTTKTPVLIGTKLTGERIKDTVWNIKGPNYGAFDLLNGVTVAKNGADSVKDLVDMSTDDSGGVTFTKSWSSLNESFFKRLPASFDYENATDSTVAWVSGGPGRPDTVAYETGPLTVNSVILVKLRRNTRKALIKITAVVETANDNKDYILFNYKLAP